MLRSLRTSARNIRPNEASFSSYCRNTRIIRKKKKRIGILLGNRGNGWESSIETTSRRDLVLGAAEILCY